MRRTLFDTGGAVLLTALIALSGVAHAQHMLCPPMMAVGMAEEAPGHMAHRGHAGHRADDAGHSDQSEMAQESDGSHDPGSAACDSCELCQTAPITPEFATAQVDVPTVAWHAPQDESPVPSTNRAWDHPPLLAIPPPFHAAAV